MNRFKQVMRVLYCLLFFAACFVPGILLLKGTDGSSSENRALADFPQLRTENGEWNQAWNTELQAYVSDHFGGRELLVTANAHLKKAAFHVSAEEDVIVGKDGWLYYTPTVNDYLGNPTISPLGIRNIVHNLEMMQDFSESRGSTFAVMVVPNKNTVYPEHMPYNYVNSGTANNLANLTAAIADSDVNWCSAAEALVQNARASGDLLYHRTDTHWNNSGALVGCRTLMETLGRNCSAYDGVPYTVENSWNGDLQEMLFPHSGVTDQQNVYAIDFTYTYQGRYRSSDDITINTLSPAGNGKLLMFRDSFGAAIIPYLSEQFQTARYSRSRPNPMYNLENEPFDAVVLEIVERNIAWLQKEAPMHSAPRVSEVPTADQPCTASLYTEQNGSTLLHLYGTAELPSGLTAAPAYYVTLTNAAGDALSYLAYNCYEADLLGDDVIRDNGYSLYIPCSDLVPGMRYEVSLVIGTEQGNMGWTFPDFSFDE